MNEWFYERDGERLGPVPEDNLRAHRESGTVKGDTLVWTKSFGSEWRRYQDSGLDSPVVPPLPTSPVDASFAWIYALVPIIGTVVEAVVRSVAPQVEIDLLLISLLYAALYGGIAYLDGQQIEKAGRHRKTLRLGFFFWLAPAYLFARARVLGESQVLLHVWVAAFILSAVISSQNLL